MCISELSLNFNQQFIWRECNWLNCITPRRHEVMVLLMDERKGGLESRSVSVHLQHYSGNRRPWGKEPRAWGWRQPGLCSIVPSIPSGWVTWSTNTQLPCWTAGSLKRKLGPNCECSSYKLSLWALTCFTSCPCWQNWDNNRNNFIELLWWLCPLIN